MKYTKFKIENFKGIKEITIDLQPQGAGIFTLIGLNESGKTSILEAINIFYSDFSTNNNTKQLYSIEYEETDPVKLIPKNLLSNFSDNIKITATLSINDETKQVISKAVFNKQKQVINISGNEIVISKAFTFKNSTFEKKQTNINCNISYTPKRARTVRNISEINNMNTNEVEKSIYTAIVEHIPIINYFPTFLFSHPEKIKIHSANNDQSDIDRIYTKILSKIALNTTNKLSLKTHIIKRALDGNEGELLDASLDDIANLISKDVFSAWKNILQQESMDNREISLKCSKDQNKNVYIQFQIKQGNQKYNFMDRSLGFRWFFSFLLFTHYNKENEDKSMLLLLDEPASNLHAKAQEELLNSFLKITDTGNQIMYSTHSHYMINPNWLDQAYIISNSAINYNMVIESTDKYITNISAKKYRTYVGENPTKTSYFQPVLDKLNITPSKLDLLKPCVIVEGKSDYFILEYGRKILTQNNTNASLIPVNGATTIDGVVSLLRGWGVPFLIFLDDDKAGRKTAKIYQDNFLLDQSQIKTLRDLSPLLENKEISSLLNNDDIQIIKDHFNNKNELKSQIQLFFSEHLATQQKIELSEQFNNYIKNFNKMINDYFKKVN